MSYCREKDNTGTVIVSLILVAVCLPVLIWFVNHCNYMAHQDEDRRQALHIYAIKTGGHLEQYPVGKHTERRYVGEMPTNDSKGGTTARYEHIQVEDFADRIIYFDDRPPYYPEDHDEWKQEYNRIRKEHGDKDE